jgi:hypothetical protein
VVRKVFARDVKIGSPLSTVFRVGDKERHTAKSGKVFLSMTLFDKTGRLDGRIFDNVDAAEAAFANDDYLLVSGKVMLFHGKPQLMIERLEKLDPEPIDPKEFAAPPPGSEREKQPELGAPRLAKQTRQRLLNLLDDPAVASGIEALMKHLERYIDDRVEQRLSGGPPPEKRTPRPPRSERPDRPERAERSEEKKPEPHKSGLPKDLAFKPFNSLENPQGEKSSGENSPPTPSGS